MKTKAKKAVFEEWQTTRANGIGIADPHFWSFTDSVTRVKLSHYSSKLLVPYQGK